MLTAAIFIALNNSLISKTYFPQCLFFKKKNTHLQTLYLCSLDAIRLSSSRETQQILIENPHQIFREGQYWKGGIPTMNLDAFEFSCLTVHEKQVITSTLFWTWDLSRNRNQLFFMRKYMLTSSKLRWFHWMYLNFCRKWY